jgi:hypothetical protein
MDYKSLSDEEVLLRLKTLSFEQRRLQETSPSFYDEDEFEMSEEDMADWIAADAELGRQASKELALKKMALKNRA